MKISHLFSFFILSSSIVTGSLRAADTGAIARVGDTEIKIEEVRPLLQDLSTRELAALTQDPALLNQFIRSLIVQRLVLKEALSKKWDKQPDVETELARLRENALAASYLKSVAAVPADYPSAAELEAAYQTAKTSLLVPRQYRLAQIYIALPKDSDKTTADAAQAKLTAVRSSLQQPNADFAAIAKAQSDDKESGSHDGEIGWLTDSQIQPEIRNSAASLAKNAVSDPIRLDDGWHVIKLLEIKDSYTPSFDEVKQPLVQQLRADRLKANSEAYLNKLLQDNRVAINELALAQLLPSTGNK